ncbi:SGNH/GDSL hydrolase family protein [Crocosphaera sp.]|uniref:SGNH/GDSL hydrolase family protein n=1 Tax=Crocosphaera sp. TaxID=2729996 RepID=UPI00261C94E9|nr:SGNH/GDSL hydrolase family protein [Crocosphaera sp.]MDJ0579431.1 SGNH/GDSL hydrolase family protein [Crocosphaera sp.]
MKIVLLSFGIILISFLIFEGSLRLFLGLGKRPLYIADDEIGYLLAPNQKVRRLGKLTIINQYSMRTEAIESSPLNDTIRLFFIGDSIVNGAWWTDQKETISALVQEEIDKKLSPTIEVLNASANSWGPRNQLAYLKRFGTFESQVILLVINTDDLFATKPTPLRVGKDISYPDKQPILAIEEILERVFYRNPNIPGLGEIMGERGDRVGFNLEAIDKMKAITTENESQFMIVLTPLKREMNPEPRDYEKVARKRLQEWVDTNNVAFIDFLPIFSKQENIDDLYRDHIHLSSLGDQLVSQHISQLIINSTNQ